MQVNHKVSEVDMIKTQLSLFVKVSCFCLCRGLNIEKG